MNKIFKVIWSKTKNCYVVASELAKVHSKVSSKGISRTLVCGVLATLFSFGAIVPNVMAREIYTFNNSNELSFKACLSFSFFISFNLF